MVIGVDVVVEVGSELVALSLNVSVTWLAPTLAVPTPDMSKVSCWAGETTSTPTACGEVWLKLVMVTVVPTSTPPTLLTVIIEGYGVAIADTKLARGGPMVIELVLVKLVVQVPIVKVKVLVPILFGPSYRLNVARMF